MATHNARRGKTDWERLERTRDADVRKAAKSDPDAAPVASREWFLRARLSEPPPKMPVSIRLDEDVVKWFRARGRGYQTRMNAVLRAYVEFHRSA
jgi:uncharacterized protein (DUF4415 family)